MVDGPPGKASGSGGRPKIADPFLSEVELLPDKSLSNFKPSLINITFHKTEALILSYILT